MSTEAQEAKALKLKRDLKRGNIKFRVRFFNRCHLTGRARGYIRRFGVSRIMLRDLALKGLVPGVRKASW